MTGSRGRQAKGWVCAFALAVVLSLGLGADLAAADSTQTAFTLRVKSEAGAGALKVSIDECVWDPVLARYTWSLVEPFTVSDPITNDAIATLVMARVQLYVGASPRIQLDFGVEAGGTTTSFILEPGVVQVSSPSITVGGLQMVQLVVPEARATVSLSLADQNNDGAELRGIGPPGTGIFQARFNGVIPNGYLFSTMLWQILCGPGGSAKVAQYDPPTGYAGVGIAVKDMSTYVGFTLSPHDLAQGSVSLRVRFVQAATEAVAQSFVKPLIPATAP
jgi:hypothetical protein